MSTAPAKILKLPAGELGVGAPADIVLFDPNEKWTVEPERFASKGRNTPFAGWELTGRVRRTIVSGKTVYDAAAEP
jgi:dihydroorotase